MTGNHSASPARRGNVAPRATRSLRRGIHHVAWFVKGVLGEDAYEKYRAHWEATHSEELPGGHGVASGGGPATPPRMMTEREFWRDRTDRQDTNPGARCC